MIVNDRMQRGYRYERSATLGGDFAPGFEPELTPPEMLRLGVFCGKYLTDCRGEFPASWFTHARLATGKADCTLNYYGVRASVPLKVWRDKGWLHPDDPRGWFQWYGRYFSGRRMEDDGRQIGRWRAFRRHAAQVRKHCEPGDPFCCPKQRQALLQWAYDSREL
ncbi:MAG: hypothetical protein ABIP24_10175 [Croceibacterium sp.]